LLDKFSYYVQREGDMSENPSLLTSHFVLYLKDQAFGNKS